METFNVGDKVYIASFMYETGTIESIIEGTNNFKVKLDSDSTIVEVNVLDLNHTDK